MPVVPESHRVTRLGEALAAQTGTQDATSPRSVEVRPRRRAPAPPSRPPCPSSPQPPGGSPLGGSSTWPGSPGLGRCAAVVSPAPG